MNYETMRGNDPNGNVWVSIDCRDWFAMTNEQFELWTKRIEEKQRTKRKPMTYQELLDEHLRGLAPKTCECGGDAVKAVYHADYCPKYENT